MPKDNQQDGFSSLSRSDLKRKQEQENKKNQKPLTRLEISQQRLEREKENSKLHQFTEKAEHLTNDLFKQNNKIKNKRTILNSTNSKSNPTKIKPGQYDPNKVDHKVGIITSPKKSNLNFSSSQKKTFAFAGIAIIAVFLIYIVAFNHTSKNSADKSTKIESVNSSDYDSNKKTTSLKKSNETNVSKSNSAKKHSKHHYNNSEDYEGTNDENSLANNTSTDSEDNFTSSTAGNYNNSIKSNYTRSNTTNHRKSYSNYNNDDNQATYTIPDNSKASSTRSNQNFDNVNDALEYGRNHINGQAGNSNFHVSNGENGGYQVTFY